MGDNKSVYRREAYSALSLLGDFGGFADALTLIFGLSASIYSAKMFNAAISEEIPLSSDSYRKRSRSKIHSEWYHGI